jgi:hypothetical protein
VTRRLEDDIINDVVTLLRPVSHIVASGGNQSRVRFRLEDGRFKAPDIVAYGNESIVVLEAKILASGLFLGTYQGGLSDCEVMLSLLTSLVAQESLRTTIGTVLAGRGVEMEADVRIVPGLVSGSPFLPTHLEQAEGLVCIEVQDGQLTLAQGAAVWPFPGV